MSLRSPFLSQIAACEYLQPMHLATQLEPCAAIIDATHWTNFTCELAVIEYVWGTPHDDPRLQEIFRLAHKYGFAVWASCH